MSDNEIRTWSRVVVSSKPWWKSRGVWGAMTAALTSVVTLVIYGLVAGGVMSADMLPVILPVAVTLAASLLALVGRIYASQTIKLPEKKDGDGS